MRIAVAIALACGCTEIVPLAGPLTGLVSLDVSPADTTLTISDLAQPRQSVAFQATAHFSDGSTRDVTALVAWTPDAAAPGAFELPGVYTTSNAAGGHVTITASSGTIGATATLSIVVSVTIVDGVFPPPAGTDALFAVGAPIVTADPMHSPSILYPSDDTMFPQGLARILFQYTRGMTNDAFRLSFDSDVLHLIVLTGSDRWQPDAAIWTLIAASNAGQRTRFVVEGASTMMQPSPIYASRAVSLPFSRTAPGGILDYWSAGTNAVMHGTLGATFAGTLYPGNGDPTCVGCHAVSRDGRSMALGYGGETLQTIDLSTMTVKISAAAQRPMGWATFSPLGDRALVANKGVLTLVDASTNAPIGSGGGRVPLAAGVQATHPDWSPDGYFVAVAIAKAGNNMDVNNGSIARISYQGGAWGVPEVLVAAAGNENNYFPRYSPDGRFIAYIHATTSSRGAPTAELRLIRADGGTPIALRLASHRVAGVDDVPNLADTMPTWAPITGDLAWLSFASARPYGAVLPMAGRGQIWIAGLDLAQLEAGADPSFAAFWLPCQDVTVLNNNPVWALPWDTSAQ